jgi:hypothetical protein
MSECACSCANGPGFAGPRLAIRARTEFFFQTQDCINIIQKALASCILMMPVFSVRAGVFFTDAGRRILDSVLANSASDIKREDLQAVAHHLDCAAPPNLRSMLEVCRCVEGGCGDLHEREVRAMDYIRDAFRSTTSSRNCRRKRKDAVSVVTEWTSAGSVFSRVS